MTFGASALIPLFKLLVVVVFAMVFFVIVVLGIVARMVGISIFSIMKILKRGITNEVTSFGEPKRSIFFIIIGNTASELEVESALYQSIAALFVAQMYDMHLSLTEQLVLMATLMIASKGNHI
jgi:proton glutamate symport protein